MLKNILKKYSCIMAVLVLLSQFSVMALDVVKPTKEEYTVEFNEATGIFLGNSKAVDMNKGDEIYLIYTVDKVSKDETNQHGIMATTEYKGVAYPYNTRGWLQYENNKKMLFEVGYTYFFKFAVTEEGFEYVAARAKDDTDEYIAFLNGTGEIKNGTKYAGIWFVGGNVTATLSHVRCYDKKGNDLGVEMNFPKQGSVYQAEKMVGRKDISHYYEFEVKDEYNLAISNARSSKANVVYMEYTVASATNNINQQGVEMTNSPTAKIPHAGNAAFLRYDNLKLNKGEECKLLTPGAKYLIRFERNEDDFDATVKYTLGGVTKYLKFSSKYGAFKKDYGYFTLWFGDGSESTLTASFKEFKCYDEKGNNLAIQTNKGITVKRIGGIENYDACEGVYYCAANSTFIALDANKGAKIYKDGDQTKVAGSYFVDGAELKLTLGGTDTIYSYMYRYMTDADNNEYLRLKENKVKFVSGKEDTTVIATAENNFKIAKPENPTSKNGTFKGWCYGDGKEFDFNTVITEATTLYAKWVDGDGNEYLAVENDTDINFAPFISVAASVLMVAVTVVLAILFVKRKKQ